MFSLHKRFFSSEAFGWAVLGMNIMFIGFATWMGFTNAGNPSYYFDEGRVATWFSVLELLAIAAMALTILAFRRREVPWTGWRTPWIVWALIGAAFVFLAADDAFKIHERLDGMIHKVFHLQQTPLSDRIDDAIIGIYGLVAVGVVIAYRRELARFKATLPLLLVAFLLLFLQVGFDMLGNQKDWLAMFIEDRHALRTTHHWVETIEGAIQLLAECVFLMAICRGISVVLPSSTAPGETQRLGMQTQQRV